MYLYIYTCHTNTCMYVYMYIIKFRYFNHSQIHPIDTNSLNAYIYICITHTQFERKDAQEVHTQTQRPRQMDRQTDKSIESHAHQQYTHI